MSLKDDFLEALRSVKRDFLKDYEYTDTAPQTAPAQFAAEQPPIPQQQPAPPPAAPAGPTAMSDEEIDSLIRDSAGPFSESVAGANASSAYEERTPEIHSAAGDPPPELELLDDEDAFDEDDEDSYAPDVDPTPFRNADDPAVSEFLTGGPYPPGDMGGSGMPPSDGRIIIDDFGSGDSPADERTIISKNTVIRGALQTNDSVRLFGQILGDIDCKSNILVAGKVRGNTSAANAYVINAQVDGNLLCDDVINVTDDAWILGNIRAQQADIDGKIKGNIEIRHAISVGSNSSIIGNISTDELEIKRGAFVNGQIMMYSPSRDVIDRFDRFDQ